MTLKNGFGESSLFVLSANGRKDQNKDYCKADSEQLVVFS